MSEELESAELEDIVAPVEEEQAEIPLEDEPAEFSRDDWEQSFVDKAQSQGWTDYPEYVAGGGDPKNWRPAREFVDRGEMISELKGLRQQNSEKDKLNDERIRNLNKLHEGQMALTLKDLEDKRNNAIARGETEEALGYIEEIDQTKDNMRQSVEPTEDLSTQSRAQDLDSMIKADNAWIYGTGDKAEYAQFMLKKEWDSGADAQTIMRNVTAKVDKMFPNVNQNRNQPAPTGPSGGPRGKASPRKLTMQDITPDERKLRAFFTNEKDFLQAVQDDRA